MFIVRYYHWNSKKRVLTEKLCLSNHKTSEIDKWLNNVLYLAFKELWYIIKITF